MIGPKKANLLIQKRSSIEKDIQRITSTIKAMFLFGSSEFLHSSLLRVKTTSQLLPQAPIVKKKPKIKSKNNN
jgi:hypothetical protein